MLDNEGLWDIFILCIGKLVIMFLRWPLNRAARSKALWTIIMLATIALFFAIIVSQLGDAGTIDTLPTRASAIPTNAVKVLPSTDIYPPIMYSDEWSSPVPLNSGVNTAGGEDSAFIMPDGKTIYFFFTPDVNIPAEKQLLDKVTGIYVSNKVNSSWSEASRIILQDKGKLALDGCPCIQGDIMWFCSAREGYNGINMFTANVTGGKWCCWSYTGDLLNLNYEIGEVHLSNEGQSVYFHSSRQGGLGGLDIWVSDRINGTWQEPVNLESINTAGDEGWPFVTADGQTLWFTRTYLGTPAIFRSTLMNGTWSSPEMIISQFAAEPSVDMEGNIYFTHHFFVNGTMIEADIYVAYKKG